jgi:hypothetical protein
MPLGSRDADPARGTPTPAATISIAERVDIAGHRFVLCGRVVVVGGGE